MGNPSIATMAISLPDPMKEWIEAKVEKGDYASTSGYVRDLVRKDRARAPQDELTLEDLRRIVAESRASGLSTRTFEEIIAEGDRLAKERGVFRE